MIYVCPLSLSLLWCLWKIKCTGRALSLSFSHFQHIQNKKSINIKLKSKSPYIKNPKNIEIITRVYKRKLIQIRSFKNNNICKHYQNRGAPLLKIEIALKYNFNNPWQLKFFPANMISKLSTQIPDWLFLIIGLKTV